MSKVLVARNSALLLVGQFVARVSGLVVFATVTRFLSVEEIGLFGYAMSMVGFLTIVVDFGFDMVVTREAARGVGPQAAGLALRLKTLQFAVFFPVLVAAAWLQAGKGPALVAVALLGAAVWHESANRTVAACYLALGRAEYGVVSEASAAIVRLLLVPVLLLGGARVVGVAAGYWVASAATAGVLAAWAWRHGFRAESSSPRGESGRVFREAAAFAAYGLLFTVSFRLDMVTLKGVRPDDEVGRYYAAFRVIEAMLVLPAVVTGAVYPLLSRLHGDGDREGFGRACAGATRALAVAGVGAALAAAAAAPLVIRVVAGPGYDGAAVYLRWLLASFVLIDLQCVSLVALNAAGRQRANVWVMLVGAAAKLAWNLSLIPSHGAMAASVGCVVVSGIVTAHLAFAARHWYRPSDWVGSWGGAVVAACASVAVLAGVPRAADVWRLALALSVFVIGTVLTGALRRTDLVTVRELWRARAAGAVEEDR
jgi:O-antigen/teichoic acid export membrane protein